MMVWKQSSHAFYLLVEASLLLPLGKPVDSKVPSLQVGILKDHAPRYSAPDQALGTQTYIR